MRRRLASFLIVAVASLCAPALAQEQTPSVGPEPSVGVTPQVGPAPSVGVSNRAFEMRLIPGIGFLEPTEVLMCKALVGPVAGTFTPEFIGHGEGFGYVIENESDVPVAVVFESRDSGGILQGSLVTEVAPASARRLSLHFWTDMRSDLAMTTTVRVTALQGSSDISVVVGQQNVGSGGYRPDLSGQVMDCTARRCVLRGRDSGVEGAPGDVPVGKGAGIGPHGPHVVDPDHAPDAAMPDGFPGVGPGSGIGPHGPHSDARPVEDDAADPSPAQEGPAGQESAQE